MALANGITMTFGDGDNSNSTFTIANRSGTGFLPVDTLLGRNRHCNIAKSVTVCDVVVPSFRFSDALLQPD